MHGYAIMIGDDPQQKLQSKRKTYAPIVFGSKTFQRPNQNENVNICEKSFGNFLRILRIWTLNVAKYFSRNCFYCQPNSHEIFPFKNHSTALWNACDYVLQYNFVIAHVAGAMNTAADFLSRTEINPKEKLEMNLRNDIQKNQPRFIWCIWCSLYVFKCFERRTPQLCVKMIDFHFFG